MFQNKFRFQDADILESRICNKHNYFKSNLMMIQKLKNRSVKFGTNDDLRPNPPFLSERHMLKFRNQFGVGHQKQSTVCNFQYVNEGFHCGIFFPWWLFATLLVGVCIYTARVLGFW